MRKTILSCLAILGVSGTLYFSTTLNTPSLAASAPLTASALPSFADLADALLPSVVNISSTQKLDAGDIQTAPELPDFPNSGPFEDFFNDFMKRHQDQMQAIPPTSLGSGFIIDKAKGYIVTNNHVIKDAQEIRITLHDNAVVNASVIGKDDKTDLALLQADLQDHDVAQAPLGDSDIMRVGDWVVAIGNPFGLGGTVTAGIVSARKRDINAGPYDDFIQTDASINKGNSGGPMFNLKGEVIGINTAIYSPSGGSVGIGFAIPSSMAKSVIDQLVKYGKTRRGWLGVRIQTVTEEIAQSFGLDSAHGALVASITPSGPAEKAGLKTGDIILTFNGKNVPDMRALPRIVADSEIDKTAPATVWRDGKKINLSVTVGELEKAEEQGLIEKITENDTQPQNTGTALADLHIHVGAITPELRSQYNLEADTSGLIVLDVDMKSDAARKGLAEGDVIMELNQTPLETPADAQKALAAAKTAKKSSILLLVNRGGDVQFIAVKLSPKRVKQTPPKNQ